MIAPEHSNAAVRTIARGISSGGDRMALDFQGRTTSFSKMECLAKVLSGLLDAQGIDRDAPVLLVSRNRPMHAASITGMAAQGRSITNVYSMQSPSAIAAEIRSIRPQAILADRTDCHAVIIQAAVDVGALLIELDNETGTLGVLRDSGRRDPAHSYPALCEPGLEILSSGTTGKPKRIHLPYRLINRFLETALAAGGPDPARFTDVVVMPFSSIGGIATLLANSAMARGTAILEKFSVDAWVSAVEAHRPEYVTIPPVALRMLLDSGIARECLSSIRYVTGGGAKLDPALQIEFEERYDAKILWGYGATEFCGTAACWDPALYEQYYPAKRGSVGKALPGIDLRIVADDTGEALPAGSVGLIEAMIPPVSKHWIRTTDLGMIDSDGFLWHHGRNDGAIVRGGFKVMPEKIVAALRHYPGIADVGVAAVPHRRLGHIPVAIIQLLAGQPKPDKLSLLAHAKEHLVAHHVPADFLFADELPRTLTMKIDQRALNRIASEMRDRKGETDA